MDISFTVVLIFHIAAGFTAFVAAPVAMAVKKGGQRHRVFGRVFFWCMAVVSSTGFIMSVLHPNVFLFAVSGFSFYMVASGYRWVIRKQVKSIREVPWIDWVLVGMASVFNLFLFLFGLLAILDNPVGAFGYIAAVFGLIGTVLVIGNIRGFISPPEEKYAWLLNHMGGMIGGYIATISAFSAVNFHFFPALIQWLWPTIIGVPLLLTWINYYKRKLSQVRKVSKVPPSGKQD